MDKSLAELLAFKQKQSGSGGDIDWDERRDKYLKAVRALYEEIKAMLAEPIGQKTVTLSERTKPLTETYIGTYSVDDLVLVIGGEQVRFSPRGRNIAGAAGRVDVVGEKGEATLLLQDSGWGFVQTRQPKVTVAPLNEATFAEVLRSVMRD